MAVVVPAIGQLLWGEPLNNALLGLDAAIQGKVNQADFNTLTSQVAAVQVQASNAQATANNALTTANNVPGTIKVGITAPPSPTPGQYWDNGSNLFRWTGSSWQPPNYLRPVITNWVSSPATYASPNFTDYTSAQWPPAVVTVPPSGQVKVTITGAVQNTNNGTSTGWMTWRASGAITKSASEDNSISTWGSRLFGTRVYILTGMTPGTTLTVTPQYAFSSVNPSGTITRATNGQLILEPLPL